MSHPSATAIEGLLWIDGVQVPTAIPVAEAVDLGDRVIAIYAPDADPRSWGTFRNLVALDRRGAELWVAETATTTTGDCWTKIASARPLRVYAFSGYICTINAADGRITERSFTK